MRAATAARIDRSRSGRKATRAPSTSTETATRTTLGTGSRQTSSPRLTTVTRQSAPRSSQAEAARTTDGPPPSTDGMRWESAPKSSWAAKPTATTAATVP